MRPRGFTTYSLILMFATMLGGNVGFVFLDSSLPICAIQGEGLSSPYHGKTVSTQGVVTADFDDTSFKKFFIQIQNCDGDSETSDGIAVSLPERLDLVNEGDRVEVRGTVEENFGLTEISVDADGVTIISSGNVLPAAVDLDPPFENSAAKGYFESLEGMLVKLNNARVVGPTNSRDVTWVIRNDLGLERVFRDDPAGTGEIVGVDDQGLFEVSPEAKVGDRVTGLRGVLGFTLGTYRIHLTTAPTLFPVSSSILKMRSSADDPITFGSINLENLFDTIDDPTTDDTVLSGTDYHRKLEKLALTIAALGEPAFLAFQEAENATVLYHLNLRPEIKAEYAAILIDGPDMRGIDVAFYYRSDQVKVISYAAHQGCTILLDGLGPDGNRDISDPQNAVTCDSDGDFIPDGNRLFSRPPLVVKTQLTANGMDDVIWVIAVHWKSKTEDTETQEFTLPRRIEQAQFTAGLVDEILNAEPQAKIIVLGDFNDYADSEPLQILKQAGMLDLVQAIPKAERYSYIYEGVSQVLDHALVSPALHTTRFAPAYFHICTDFPYSYQSASGTMYRSSDHDPILTVLDSLAYQVFIPILGR